MFLNRKITPYVEERSNKLLLTTEELPSCYRIKHMYNMVQITRAVEISKKGLIRGFLERKRNEYEETLDELMLMAPENANAIIGIRVSTTTQQYAKATYLYITYIGTPVFYIKQHKLPTKSINPA
ncbi:hypothetical protein [Zooshikella harenae]|uniref:Uncharacterized protein n=1 Tax=Zooshikella harenae TaxID=2827238 RepID=A0ABS5ZDS5_9GAMM|nr:hypothetical protein [Zooshikella harenae]MBU2711102.1 hypothetical protein [Zooshikella harenae]